jgi:hypothetical protein
VGGEEITKADLLALFYDDRDYHSTMTVTTTARPAQLTPWQTLWAPRPTSARPCLAAGDLSAGNSSACLSGKSQEANSTLGLCDWRIRCAALHRLRRRRFCSATTTAGNASRNLHAHGDCYRLQFKRAASKYARHVDRQVMAGWKELMVGGRRI